MKPAIGSAELLKGQKILVVEDEPDSLEVATLLLEMVGANVITASTGREGLEMIRQHRPLFVISDLSMPDMNGWEMVDELKQSRATWDIPVIALTAHAMEGDRARALGAGFHNYLTKPLRPETFVRDLLNVVMDAPVMVELSAQANGEA